jgi:hypothetical protein
MQRVPALVMLQKVFRRLPFAAFDVNCLHCLEFEMPGAGQCTFSNAQLEIREGTFLDLDRMALCQNFPDRLSERFEAHEHCVIAAIGTKVIGYQWFCDKPTRIEERYGYPVEIPADALYGYDAFVLPQYRRMKVWTAFHTAYLNALLARLHRRRVIVMVDQSNVVSMRAHLRLGYKLFRKVYVLKFFGKVFWVTRECARVVKELRPLPSSDPAGRHVEQATGFSS